MKNYYSVTMGKLFETAREKGDVVKYVDKATNGDTIVHIIRVKDGQLETDSKLMFYLSTADKGKDWKQVVVMSSLWSRPDGTTPEEQEAWAIDYVS